jgi:predicted membrane-bound spermidine synthase
MLHVEMGGGTGERERETYEDSLVVGQVGENRRTDLLGVWGGGDGLASCGLEREMGHVQVVAVEEPGNASLPPLFPL